ncbi:hypothetical protein J6590_019099 [Homalodisca vitripennis]|nr:hypothetical protein J6590_019099 [Homalodisca vitripennis]
MNGRCEFNLLCEAVSSDWAAHQLDVHRPWRYTPLLRTRSSSVSMGSRESLQVMRASLHFTILVNDDLHPIDNSLKRKPALHHTLNHEHSFTPHSEP